MATRKKKKSNTNFILAIIMIVLMLLMARTIISTVYSVVTTTLQVEKNKDNLEQLQAKQKELQAEIDRLGTPEYLATFAKGEFFLSSGEEDVFILPSSGE